MACPRGPMRWGLVLTCLYMAFGAPTGKPTAPSTTSIIVVGSLNADIIIPVHRLPSRGETITARSPASQIAVGGKGANQAVAAARLTAGTPRKTRFICRFGNDAYAGTMEAALVEAGVDVSGCGHAPDLPSGQGIVLLEADGTASSVVLGGANTAWGDASLPTPNTKEGKVNKGLSASHIVDSAGMVLLQREIPEEVNLAVARAAHHADIPVLLDVGGEDRPLSDEMLRLVTYLAPNESELQRLTGMPTANDSAAVAAAQTLIQRGARSVLVTLAERGSLLVKAGGVVLQQAAVPVPGGKVVDGTAAGDAFRAAFAVALVEGWPEQASMEFAAAAGAVAVSRMGAVPSLPSKDELLPLLSPEVRSLAETRAGTGVGAQADKNNGDAQTCSETCNGGEAESTGSPSSSTTASRAPVSSSAFPYKFASRLNSMQARRDLVTGKEESANDVFGWIARQGHIRGLDLVDFNYPQHLQGQSLRKITAALTAAGLRTGAICIRFPEIFHLGAFSNPNATLRAQAVALAVDGCRWAADLGARDLIVWSPYDGYDYHFQVEYQAAWQRSVEAFQQLADACPPGVRVSLEFKPTDEATRYSIVPSTGAALLFAEKVNRPNFGLTLDMGHMLMAGENPAQSVAAVGMANKLFGMQLNDAHVRLGAEDGLAFGAVNPVAALELVAWLRRVHYDGHIYFDTFPRKEDPVREAEYNIRRFKALWARAERLEAAGLRGPCSRHDAIGVMEVLEKDEL